MSPDDRTEAELKSETTAKPELKSGESGSKLDENYEFIGTIGSGGMGSVEKAKHKILGQFVAVKRIRDNKAADESARNRFINEAKAASRLKHVNLASVREFGLDYDGNPYAVMDFIDGVDLSKLIKEGKTQSDPKRVLEIVAQVADGLEHAHQNGIVHRDIKPSNIIISTDEYGKDRATIVDFGIAKITESEGQRLTQTGEIFGSPFYLSPEQAIGKPVDHRSDIYSLACVIYECLAGTPPFVGENPMQTAMKHLNEDIPDLAKNCKVPLPSGLNELVTICLQKDPENRFKTAGDLAGSLRAIKEGRRVKISGRRTVFQKYKIWIMLANVFIGLSLLAVFCLSNMQISGMDGIDELKISSLAKTALKVDMDRAMQEYNSKAYEKSAHSLLGTNLILEKELKEIKRKKESAKTKAEYGELYGVEMKVNDYFQQNLVHVGMCYLNTEEFGEACSYFEKALPHYRDYVEKEQRKIERKNSDPPPRQGPAGQPNPIVELYEYYIQALAKSGEKRKLSEIESEYAKTRKALKWGEGYLLIKRPWPSFSS